MKQPIYLYLNPTTIKIAPNTESYIELFNNEAIVYENDNRTLRDNIREIMGQHYIQTLMFHNDTYISWYAGRKVSKRVTSYYHIYTEDDEPLLPTDAPYSDHVRSKNTLIKLTSSIRTYVGKDDSYFNFMPTNIDLRAKYPRIWTKNVLAHSVDVDSLINITPLATYKDLNFLDNYNWNIIEAEPL